MPFISKTTFGADEREHVGMRAQMAKHNVLMIACVLTVGAF